MEVRLVIKKGATRSKVIKLRNTETIVGRRNDCDLRIESSAVSRRHCLLRVHGGKLTIEDLDSINGTLVNGEKVKGKATLKPGDKLQIGPVTFHVEVGEEMPEAPPPTPKPVVKTHSSKRLKPESPTARIPPRHRDEEEEELDVLPFADDSNDEPPPTKRSSKKQPPVAEELDPSDSVMEAMEVAEELESNEQWHLPESEDLRDILADMDEDEDKPLKT